MRAASYSIPDCQSAWMSVCTQVGMPVRIFEAEYTGN